MLLVLWRRNRHAGRRGSQATGWSKENSCHEEGWGVRASSDHCLLATPLSSVILYPTRSPEWVTESLMDSPLLVGGKVASAIGQPHSFRYQRV